MTVKIRCSDDTQIREMQADKIAYCNNGTIGSSTSSKTSLLPRSGWTRS